MKRTRLYFLVALLLIGLCVSVGINLPPWLLRRRAMEHYRQGLAFEREGKMDRALAEWRIAADTDKDFPDPYHKLGDFLLEKADRPDLAAQNFRWLVAIDPHGSHVYCKLAQALTLKNELAEARSFGVQAVKAEPDCPLAHHIQGILMMTDHHIKDGLPHLELACRLAPKNTRFAVVLAKAYLDLSDFSKAEQTLEGILQREPNHAEAHYLLGWAYNRGGRSPQENEKAALHFREATRLQPDDADSYGELGKLLFQTGHLQEAQEALEKAWKINPRLVLVANNLTQVYQQRGQEKKALAMEKQARTLMERSDRLRELRKKAEIYPNDLTITLQLAEVELDDGNLSDAMRYTQGVLTQRPSDRHALELLRKIYIFGGKPEMAEAVQEHLKTLPGASTR